MTAQVFSLVGAALVLFGFGSAQLGRLTPNSIVYQIVNLIGGGCLATSAVITQNWGFTILNAVWVIFAVYKIVQISQRPRATTA